MPLKIAINGFGRIGRLVLRAILDQKPDLFQVVAINDLGDGDANSYLYTYDSVHGKAPHPLTFDRDALVLKGPSQTIRVLSEANPDHLPWGDLNVDLVLECSGRFTNRQDGARHLAAGAGKVLISAPADGADNTIVYGVNHQTLTKDHRVVSNGSCTTNCLAPIAAILQDAVGIERGYMTTIHAYTGDQRLVDTYHTDLRRARAAGMSMIPTSTGAAKAVGLVLPALKGKLDGTAIRVPVPNVSLIDFTFTTPHETHRDAINQAVITAASGQFKGIVAVVDQPLVSVDFNHNPFSANFDATQTQVIEGRFCRVLAWYDNEWGFANRMVDTALSMGQLR